MKVGRHFIDIGFVLMLASAAMPSIHMAYELVWYVYDIKHGYGRK